MTFTIIVSLILGLLSLTVGISVASASALMGIGIAVDVTLTTLAKFRDDELSFRNWTLPIMTTHIVFPAVGYYGFWGMGQQFPELNFVLGMTGFIIMALFVYEVMCEWVDKDPIFGISAFVQKAFGFKENDARRYVAILAVSWDALWSGPAKSAQAQAGNWSDFEVGISFLIAGVTVAIVAQLSLKLTLRLRDKGFQDVASLARWTNVGRYGEVTVLSGFGILSLFQALLWNDNLYTAIGYAAVFFALVFMWYQDVLQTTATGAAEKAINGKVDEAEDAVADEKSEVAGVA